ncbi:TAXI family TRAP transporter solute-binding subunit [Actinocatenispora rupis]|uniref:C4-dicarboxylate ABC transporter substrate-binding protein n=2 Tax=Actinocatenispora rupis TaxID=519421 RepID=A0A8J3NBR3_9ACTN|nr:C4-dicarboxylate ABC transporter substrate-binding protein [Actinocatenispora rupis]
MGAAGLAGLGLAGCGPRKPPFDRLVLATGGVGGVYAKLGAAIAAAARAQWHIPTTVLHTGAAVDNLDLVAAGKADVGFATVDAAMLASDGSPPFHRRLPVAAVAGMYDDLMQLVVRADGPIRTLAGVRGRRVSVGSPGSGTELIVNRLLRIADVPADALQLHRWGAEESARALRSGRLDGFFFSGGVPTPAVAALAGHDPGVRIVPLDSSVPQLQARYGEVYERRTLAHGVYRLPPVQTFGIHNLLFTAADRSAASVAALTRLLFDHRADLVAAHDEARQLTTRSAIETYPLALHPGAEAYYRSTKPYT